MKPTDSEGRQSGAEPQPLRADGGGDHGSYQEDGIRRRLDRLDNGEYDTRNGAYGTLSRCKDTILIGIYRIDNAYFKVNELKDHAPQEQKEGGISSQKITPGVHGLTKVLDEFNIWSESTCISTYDASRVTGERLAAVYLHLGLKAGEADAGDSMGEFIAKRDCRDFFRHLLEEHGEISEETDVGEVATYLEASG